MWKAGVLKPPRLTKHAQARVEHVRKLALLNTQLDKERQHARLMRRSLRSRLQKGEVCKYRHLAPDHLAAGRVVAVAPVGSELGSPAGDRKWKSNRH